MDRRRVVQISEVVRNIFGYVIVIVRLENPLVNSGSKVGTRIQQLLRWATVWPQKAWAEKWEAAVPFPWGGASCIPI